MKSQICLFIIALFQVAQSLSMMPGSTTSPVSTRTSASGYPTTTIGVVELGGICFSTSQCQYGLACSDRACGIGYCIKRVGLNQICRGHMEGVVHDMLSDNSNCEVGLICEKVVSPLIEGFDGVCKYPSISTQPLSKTVSSTETAYIPIPISSLTITVGPTATQTGTASYDDGVTITSSAKSLSFVGFAGLLAFFLL